MKFVVVVVAALCLSASVSDALLIPLQGNPTYGLPQVVDTFEQLQNFFPQGTFDGANDLLDQFGLGPTGPAPTVPPTPNLLFPFNNDALNNLFGNGGNNLFG